MKKWLNNAVKFFDFMLILYCIYLVVTGIITGQYINVALFIPLATILLIQYVIDYTDKGQKFINKEKTMKCIDCFMATLFLIGMLSFTIVSMNTGNYVDIVSSIVIILFCSKITITIEDKKRDIKRTIQTSKQIDLLNIIVGIGVAIAHVCIGQYVIAILLLLLAITALWNQYVSKGKE